MTTRTRAAIAVLAITLSAATLSACSLLGPSRGDDGRVTDTSEINSTDLLVGDCFSFVDGTDLAKASVTPCANDHSYIVIGEGDLTDAKITELGGLQNAVSSSCAETFTTFKANAPEGSKPEQEFIVSTAEVDGEQLTSYHCVATDSAVVPAGG